LVGDSYVKEIRRELGYLAAWLPNKSMEIGEIGEIGDGQFEPRCHLREFDFKVEVEDAPAQVSLSHQSSSGVEIAFKAEGDASVVVPGVSVERAGVGMRFSRKSGVVFQANGVRHSRLKPSDALEQLVRDGHRDGKWKSSWVVVDSVVKASHLTVIVSSARRAELSLSGSSGLRSVADLADVDMNLEVAHRKDLATCIVAKGPLTPLFTGKVLRRRRWWKGEQGTLQSAFEPLPSEAEDEDVALEPGELALVAYDYPA
jgi:hypothetical protein